jgi:DNA repair exonuclease SbcCD ATPase subunit
MPEKTPPEFRFDSNDQETDEFYQEEMKDLRIEKLSQRITIIAILLPCLIAVAIFFGYRDLTGRVHRDQNRDNLEVQKLSGQLEALSEQFKEKLNTFSTTLSAYDRKFGDSISARLSKINDKLETIDKNQASLNETLEQTKRNMAKLNAAKLDKKALEDALAKINADIKPLKNDLQAVAEIRQGIKSISAEISDLKSRSDKEFASIAANADKLKKDYDLLQSSITGQLNEKIDKTALAVELLMFKKNQSLQSLELTELSRRLDSIQKQIENVQGVSKSKPPSMESLPTELPPAKSTMGGEAGSEDVLVEEQDLPPE